MHKLKTVLRSSHKKRDSTSSQSPRHSYDSSEAGSPRADHTTSPRQNGRSSLDHHGQSQQGRRSRPVSSAYDDRRTTDPSAAHHVPAGVPAGLDQTTPSDPIDGSIANDYKSYMPALSSVDDSHGDSYMTRGSDRHEEGVADRNIAGYRSSMDASRNKPLPNPPNPMNATQQQSRETSAGLHSYGSPASSLPSGISATDHSVGRAVTTNGGVADNIRPQKEVLGQSKSGWNNNGNLSERSTDRYATADGHHGGSLQDWKTQQNSLLSGVVDLRNTVDTDKDVQVAAPVVHEVVKPHEHEVIQRKIYREIHNYSYYHRLQPVMHTEVLPPRHFIPNPDGEGLIEISADELPMRTGKNRWWEIVQREVPQTYEIQSRWRTEPEIIEGKPYITEDGIERKETTIVYPPKLADMSSYDGAVQPVHFDHKTGERWLGEVTTMAKLREQYDQDMLTMRELTESLPDMPPSPTVKRKPVGTIN